MMKENKEAWRRLLLEIMTMLGIDPNNAVQVEGNASIIYTFLRQTAHLPQDFTLERFIESIRTGRRKAGQ